MQCVRRTGRRAEHSDIAVHHYSEGQPPCLHSGAGPLRHLKERASPSNAPLNSCQSDRLKSATKSCCSSRPRVSIAVRALSGICRTNSIPPDGIIVIKSVLTANLPSVVPASFRYFCAFTKRTRQASCASRNVNKVLARQISRNPDLSQAYSPVPPVGT